MLQNNNSLNPNVINNFNSQNYLKDSNLNINPNEILCNNIYHDDNFHDININNMNNINYNSNINNNFLQNITMQNKFSNILEKQTTYLYKNLLGNNINNNYHNSIPYFKEKNNNLFYNRDNALNLNNYLLNVNNSVDKNNNFDNNVKNEYSSYNFKKKNKEIYDSLNNLENSLTSTLCSKNGINKIKTLLKNEHYNTDLIRKIILTLNKENGLHIVFKNIYGNYFIQDLFHKMNSDLIQLTIDLISSDFANIAKSPSGTHCLQELLNYINDSEKEIAVIKAIKYKEKEMAFDNYAIYVLKKIISIIPDIKRIRLNNLIIDNTKELSLNAKSVFILKTFISTCTIDENKKKILNALKKNFMIISQNPFGNYVIQYIFEVWPFKDCELIVYEIFNKANELSCQRFSVNIITKALNLFDVYYRNKLIYILCFSPNILKLLKNKYGNFVIKKAVEKMSKSTKSNLIIYFERTFKDITSKDKTLINEIITLLKE